MRCEQCGRDMQNAELWQLATDPKAPTSWSMKHLCWECREHPAESQAGEETMAEYETDELVAVLVESLDGNRSRYGNSLL